MTRRRELTVVDGEFVLANPADCRDIYVTKAGLYQLFDITDGRAITLRVAGFWNDIDADDMVRIPKSGYTVRDVTVKRLQAMDPATGELFELTPTDDLQCTVWYTIKRPDAA